MKFDSEQIADIVDIWNSQLSADPTNLTQLKNKYFENPYVDIFCPILKNKSFSLICKKSKKFLYEPFREDTAWIFAMAIGNRNDLDDLLDLQIGTARSNGIKRIIFSNFSPGYFYPGIDHETYPEIYKYLLNRGFRESEEALAMDANIGELRISRRPVKGVDIKNLNENEKDELLILIEKYFPADCYKRANDVIMSGGYEQITIAKLDGKIVGYSMFSSGEGKYTYAEGERFGCFEVIESVRSSGIGSLLLEKTLLNMKSNFIRNAYFLWTGEKASHLYSRYGFRVFRKFKIMTLEI